MTTPFHIEMIIQNDGWVFSVQCSVFSVQCSVILCSVFCVSRTVITALMEGMRLFSVQISGIADLLDDCWGGGYHVNCGTKHGIWVRKIELS
jgi:hypothetical protein